MHIDNPGRRPARMRRRLLGVAAGLIGASVLAVPAQADFPYNPVTPGDYNPHDYKLPATVSPMNLHDEYRYAATPENSPASATNNAKADELCGIRGSSVVDMNASQPVSTGSCIAAATPVRTAYQVSTGRPDVVIAVLDSGIEWNDAGQMFNLRRKVHLNQGELPAPWIDPNMTSLDPAVGTVAANSPSASSCQTLANKVAGTTVTTVYENPGGVYDLFGNHAFNVTDYACDPRVKAVMSDPRRVGPTGMLTPQDLILAFGNCKITDHAIDATTGCPSGQHFDNDGNGYANDIAGWNFVDNNNDPFDDVQYAHGTGEARDSNGEAQSATTNGDLGACANCEVLPLRVGESFIADVNRFALAALYATDQGVDVIQEALGTLNNSTIARQAIEYAYRHGTTVIASAADEAAEHHNLPGALPDTIVVNSVTKYSTETEDPHSYLQFNGCTNFGSRIVVAVESTSCSSDATGRAGGIAGLIYSAALNAHETGTLAASTDPGCRRPDGSACVVTPNEVRQLMGSGNVAGTIPQTGSATGSTGTAPADEGLGGQADDIDFGQPGAEGSCQPAPTPNCTDPNHGNAFAWNPDQNGGLTSLPGTHRYPATKGWDEFYGYGRLNAYNAVNAVAHATIPPEANITSPDWFQQIDPAGRTLEVDGHTFARGQAYTCELDVAPGGEPNNAMAPSGDFTQVSGGFCDGSTTHTDPYDGALGSISLAALKSSFPANVSGFNGNENGGIAQTSNGRPNTLPYAFTVRVVVHVAPDAGAGTPAMTGEDRRQMFLHRDQDTINSHFPMDLHTDGASSPLLVDLEGSNRNDLVVATSDGVIHAYRPDGSEAPGWPVHTEPLPFPGAGAHALASGEITTDHYAAILGGVAAADLFHDGRIDIVADDNQGNVYAWDPTGQLVFHQTSNPAFSGAMQGDENFVRKGHDDRTEHGFFASPVVADLGGSGQESDIVVPGEDRHLYAWRVWPGPAAAVPGFPVEVYDHSKAHVDDPTTGHLTFNPNASAGEDQGKIVDTPAIAYLDGPGKPPSIVVGTNEEYVACPTTTATCDEGPANYGLSNPSLAAVSASGLLAAANSRLYVINHDGNANAAGAYRAGWPVKVGIVTAGLLPDVAEGVTGPPVAATTTCTYSQGGSTPNPQTEPVIGAQSYAGPAYLFNAAGQSCLGTSSVPSTTNPSGATVDNALATDAGQGVKTDTPVFPSVGNPAFGNVAGQIDYMSPGSGLIRALDAAANEYQAGGQDFLAAWNPATGQFQAGFPSPVNDLSFLTGPAVGDVLAPSPVAGTDTEQMVGGTASLDLQALDTSGAIPGQPASAAWPKLTGDWTVATPAIGTFGTLDTDAAAHKVVVSVTRSGTLTVYSTPASACAAASWPRYHHDNANSGLYEKDAVDPGVPINAAVSGATLTFLAPGNDLLCGRADHYQLATSASPITPENFASAQPIANPPAPQIAGTPESITLPAGTQRYVAVRAVDGQGNIGLPASVDTAVPAPAGGTPGSGPLVSPSGPGTPLTLSPVTAPPPKKAGGVAGLSFLGLPPSSRCLSKRSFVIHLRAPAGQRLARVQVYVNRRLVRVLAGRRLTAPVDLRGLPRGRFEVRIVARTTGGRTLTSARHYHTCTPKRKARHRKTA
jgi:hypothetical protein